MENVVYIKAQTYRNTKINRVLSLFGYIMSVIHVRWSGLIYAVLHHCGESINLTYLIGAPYCIDIGLHN